MIRNREKPQPIKLDILLKRRGTTLHAWLRAESLTTIDAVRSACAAMCAVPPADEVLVELLKSRDERGKLQSHKRPARAVRGFQPTMITINVTDSELSGSQ